MCEIASMNRVFREVPDWFKCRGKEGQEAECRIVLFDEDGLPSSFALLDLPELDERQYLALLPFHDGSNPVEVTVLEVLETPEENETFASVDAEGRPPQVFGRLKERWRCLIGLEGRIS